MNIIDRITGKDDLLEKVQQLEKKLEEATSKLEQTNRENAELKIQLGNTAQALNSSQFEVDGLRNNLEMSHKCCENLQQQISDTKAAHKAEIAEMRKQLSEQATQLEKLSEEKLSLETKNSDLETKCSALERSVEMAKPENEIPDAKVPNINAFVKKREDVYQQYCRAQEHAIKECIQQAVSKNTQPKINLMEDPSFSYVSPNGKKYVFVCKEVLERIMGKSNDGFTCPGWAPTFEVDGKHGKLQGSYHPYLRLMGEIARNSIMAISISDFFRSRCVGTEYGLEHKILIAYGAQEFSVSFELEGKIWS